MNTTTTDNSKLIDGGLTKYEWHQALLTGQVLKLEQAAAQLVRDIRILEFWHQVSRFYLGIESVTLLYSKPIFEWDSPIRVIEINTTETSLPLWIFDEMDTLCCLFSESFREGTHTYSLKDCPSLDQTKAHLELVLEKHTEQFKKSFSD
jgi:hypothetical protein